MGSLKLPHSGGNSMSIAAPATNPSGDLELKLPATIGTAGQYLKNSGTAGTLEFGGAGKILQVVQSTSTEVESQASGQSGSVFDGTYYDIAGTDNAGSGSVFCVKITPSATSSKILFTSSLVIGGSSVWAFKMYRDSTALNIHDTVTSKESTTFSSRGGSGGIGLGYYSPSTLAYSYLDSPSSTSELTYKIKWGCSHSGNTIYLNQSENDSNVYRFRGSSTLIVMEVSG